MSRTTTSIAVTAAALALVLGLAACGSSSGSDSEKKSTTTEATGTKGTDDADTTTTASDEGDDPTTTVVATGGGKFCEDLADFINDTSSSDVDVTDPKAYKKAIEDEAEKGKALLSKAPDELDDSVQVILDAQDELISQLEKVDFDYTKLPSDALSAMSSTEVQEAGQKLDSYATDTCGIDLATPEVSAPEMPDITTATVAPSGN